MTHKSVFSIAAGFYFSFRARLVEKLKNVMAVTCTRCRSWQALVNRFGHSLTWHYLGLRGDGKISKIDRKTASDGDRCLRANVGGVHGNARPEIVALTYRLVHRIQDYPASNGSLAICQNRNRGIGREPSHSRG